MGARTLSCDSRNCQGVCGEPRSEAEGARESHPVMVPVMLVRLLLPGTELGQFLHIEDYLLFVEKDRQKGQWPAFCREEDIGRSVWKYFCQTLTSGGANKVVRMETIIKLRYVGTNLGRNVRTCVFSLSLCCPFLPPSPTLSLSLSAER